MTKPKSWMLVGGRTRLGKLLAEELAQEFQLILTSSKTWEGDSSYLQNLMAQTAVTTCQWDASDPKIAHQITTDMEKIHLTHPRIESAVILAGDFPESPFGTWTAQHLQDIFLMNLVFPMLVAQGIAPAMAPGGCIQFILDTAIHRPMQKRLPYSAAKSALASLVGGLARTLAPNVRVVGHALGVVMPDKAEHAESLAALNLLKKNGQPEDLLRALRYCADSPYLTGDILTLDGGRRWSS